MAWTKEQQQAIETSGKNIIVSAGAGSGKTAVLTTRVMEHLKHHIHVNELLILTFTNAAAAEMKERIKKKLENENNQEELDLLDSSYITTFDSFSLSLVKKYHYLLNLPSHISITDSSIISLEKKRILREILDNYYKKGDTDFTHLISILCTKDDEVFFKALLKFAQKLEIRSDLDEYFSTYIEQNYNELIDSFLIDNYESILKRKCEDTFLCLEEREPLFEKSYYEKLDYSLAVLKNDYSLDELLAIIKAIRLPSVPKGSDEEIKNAKEEVNAVLKELQAMAKYHNKEEIILEYRETRGYLKIVMQIMNDYFTSLQSYKKENLLFDFGDIAKMSLQLIKDYQDIAQFLKNQFKEIMVDEYQDTSDLQEEFLSLIANHNLYMVGDIKQSIYRFRNANPSIFKNKYELYSKGVDGIKIDLLKNFRSRREVLEDINLIFNPIMDLEIGSADYYLSHQMVFGNLTYEEEGKTNENYHMDILQYSLEDKTFSKEEVEFFAIAKDIKSKIENNYLVFDKDTSELRPSTYKDYCLILDRNSSFDLAKKIFSYFEIPLTLYKDEDLNQSYDIFIIYHLFSFLVHIYHQDFNQEFTYSFVSLARSFLYRYSDEEIYLFLTEKKIFSSSLYQDFSSLSKNIAHLSIQEIFSLLLDTTHFYEKLITKGEVKETLSRVDKVMELACNVDNLSYGVEQFTNLLKSIIEKEEPINISMSSTLANNVKMMNIHKSKGLEFPVCYFCGLYKTFSRQDYMGDILYEKNFPVYMPVYNEGIKETILKLIIKENMNSQDISEKIRLFYVALTRAREKMIFLLPEKENLVERKNKNDLVYNSIRYHYKSIADMLYSIPKQLHPYVKKLDLDSLHLTKDYLLPKEKKIASILSEPLKVNDIEIPLNLTEKKTYSKQKHELISLEEKRNMEFGTLFHQTLEMIDFHDFKPELIDNAFIREKIEILLSQDLFSHISSAKVYQEYEFINQENNEISHGQIDLMLEYEDHIDIIDYKLSEILDEDYVTQLKGYQHYIESITSKNVHTYLYSILSSNLKKIS